MIPTLYKKFQYWSNGGSIWIISDTHFDDVDCKYMDSNWLEPQEHIDIIKKYVHKDDTLIHLGDVGNAKWLEQIKAYKILIMGNHDQSATKFNDYFDEIYTGALFISEKILLSHEPIISKEGMWFNIHGHDHDNTLKDFANKDGFVELWNELNLASNIANYKPYNLGASIKNGLLSCTYGIHRVTIDKASNK